MSLRVPPTFVMGAEAASPAIIREASNVAKFFASAHGKLKTGTRKC